MVTMYSSVSGPVRVKRSMRCTFSLAQKMFVLAGISVLPAPDGPVIYPIAADRTETSFVAQSFSFRGRHLSPRLSSVSRSRVSVSNWLSGRHWQLNQAPAVGNPTGIAELGPSHRASTGDGHRRLAGQRRMAACPIVVNLEIGELVLQVTGIPEQRIVPMSRSTKGCDSGT